MKIALYLLVVAIVIGLGNVVYEMALVISLGEQRQSVLSGAMPIFILGLVSILLVSKCIGQLNKPSGDSDTDRSFISIGVVKASYAQGPKSAEFKALLKERIIAAVESDKLDSLLDEIHDSVLHAKNDPSGLQAAIDHLNDGQ